MNKYNYGQSEDPNTNTDELKRQQNSNINSPKGRRLSQLEEGNCYYVSEPCVILDSGDTCNEANHKKVKIIGVLPNCV